MKLTSFFFLLCLLSGFSFSPGDQSEASTTLTVLHPQDSPILQESFIDSTAIGNRGRSKLEVNLYNIKDNVYVTIDFYSKTKAGWMKRNHYIFPKDPITGIDPKISDFNNDKFSDFHYRSTVAARGGNNVRRLFIYSPKGDSLIHIKNSESYPNMAYNKKLDCIDALMLHGCSSQAFLRIKGDSLIDFAWIQLSNYIRVYEIDKEGNEVILKQDSINGYDCYTRFETYDPLLEYEKYPE